MNQEQRKTWQELFRKHNTGATAYRILRELKGYRQNATAQMNDAGELSQILDLIYLEGRALGIKEMKSQAEDKQSHEEIAS